MTIREYAKKHDFKIVGKLTRCAEWEQTKTERCYIDEANNEYLKNEDSIVIVTANGSIF